MFESCENMTVITSVLRLAVSVFGVMNKASACVWYKLQG